MPTRTKVAMYAVAVTVGFGLADPASAQIPLEVGVTVARRHLDDGTVSAAATRSTSLGVLVGLRAIGGHVAVGVAGGYGRESVDPFRRSPGVSWLGVDGAVSLFRSNDDGVQVNPVVLAGIGAMHFASSEFDAVVRACRLADGCLFEGVSYGTGWRGFYGLGLGVDLELPRGFVLRGISRLDVLVGGSPAGNTNAKFLRLELGVLYRT